MLKHLDRFLAHCAGSARSRPSRWAWALVARFREESGQSWWCCRTAWFHSQGVPCPPPGGPQEGDSPESEERRERALATLWDELMRKRVCGTVWHYPSLAKLPGRGYHPPNQGGRQCRWY